MNTTKIPVVTSNVLTLTLSYFLNHIQLLISKNPNLPSKNHQHGFKASKNTIYIYRERERERERELKVHDFLILQTTNTITKNSMKKSWILR